MKIYLFLIYIYLIGINVSYAENADKILIEKSKRELTLLKNNKIISTYKVSLGGTPVGAKSCMGDNKTPEGEYFISARNMQSSYHRALKISYPNDRDKKNAKKLGCSPGGDIMIHGLPNGRGQIGKAHLLYDWTLGCIAVTDQEIEDIWNHVAMGTKVEIRP